VTPDPHPPVLDVEDVAVYYQTPRGPVKAVDGVSFSLQPGERLGLIGESGSGKTTMGTALLRLTRPPGRIVRGRVLLNGRDVMALSEREFNRIRLGEIALVPQGAMNALNPVMRVRDQIEDGIVAHEEVPRRELGERVAQALARVGLPAAIADRFPHELSGGQKQRVGVALGRVQEGLGAAVILIGHDMGLIAQFADTVGVLYAGKLVEYGPIDDVLTAPRHPYTRLLVDSLPTLEARRELRGIPGLPPPLLNLPPGCPFAPRCPYAFDRCRVETPLPQVVPPDQRVACHLYPQHAELPLTG
jgi:peptide/nickel transport system ATP-binding protein